MVAMAILLSLIELVEAVPQIAFPINSQVPPVARVSQPFSFVFPASTFSSNMPSMNYTLSGAPPWLRLDGGSRIFSGTPASSDVGPAAFQLIAEDDSGSADMDVKFIVSSEPGPQLGKGLSDQLRTFGPTSGASSILLYPLAPFSFAFLKDTFTGGEDIVTYYAVSADHTPLPSWVNFDSGSLRFSGVTPPWTSLIAPPQHFDIQLIASDILGFAGTAVTFSLVVSNHMLVFGEGGNTLNVTEGVPVNFTDLRSELLLDGNPINDGDLKAATAEVPDWLNFDSHSLILHGTPPPGAFSQAVNISVTDVYGDVAVGTTSIWVSSTLFASSIGNLSATAGKHFSYTISRTIFKDPNVVVKADISPSTAWLTFDSKHLRFDGNVPHDAVSSDIKVNLTATSKSSSSSGFQVFVIQVENSDARATSTAQSSSITPIISQTRSSQATATSKAKNGGSSNSRRKVAALVVAPCLFLTVAIAGMTFWCRHRHREKTGWDRSRRSPVISRPLECIEEPWPTADNAKSLDYGAPWRAPFLGTLSATWGSSTDFQHANYQQTKDQALGTGGLNSHSREIVDSREFVRLPQGDSATSASAMNFSFKTHARLGGSQLPNRADEISDASYPLKRESRSFGSYSNGNGNTFLGRRLSGGHSSSGFGLSDYVTPKRSWRRTGSSRNWETVRASDVSAVTVSTDVLLGQFPGIPVVTSPDPVGLANARPERRGYILRRGQSPFFGGTSRADSSNRSSQAWIYTPSRSAHSVSQTGPGDSFSLLDSVLKDLKAAGDYSLPSVDEPGNGSRPGLGTRFSGISQISKFSDDSSRFKSIGSALYSRDFSRDETGLAEVTDGFGHQPWHRKGETFTDQGSFYFAGESKESILEYEAVRLRGVAGDNAAASGTYPTLKLVDLKGKRPMSVDGRTPRSVQSGGSASGSLAFL
ncbi:hypothetical protein GP486_006512 [Trichoglossum hirsutum]|uniref:Dystroglycan-type cadherin-like domain-containing protein n=1 Tax=Trichoglossum hirsutum TaxID=265104 RepID=A0A9P8L7E9_9PEZI|nr:hypothetical protein GP486_006512 [Trichoglossum hirsutum]